MYEWLQDYDAFTTNLLLQLEKPTTIRRWDLIGLVVRRSSLPWRS
jgi:hypothetical protein